jgi:hypothetical protein
MPCSEGEDRLISSCSACMLGTSLAVHGAEPWGFEQHHTYRPYADILHQCMVRGTVSKHVWRVYAPHCSC